MSTQQLLCLLQVYAPSRTVAVYGPAQWGDANADQHTWGIPGLGIKDRGPHFDL